MSNVINNRNIRRLVRSYIENRNNLPPWLQGIPIGDWDVSRVTDMEELFSGYRNFNEPLTNWNVSRVTNMFAMFMHCTNFNQPLNHWNVSNVIQTSMMFYNCRDFNQPLGNWDVSHVMDTEEMFDNCRSFNQDLSNWNVSNVSTITRMFSGCESLTINPNWVLSWDVRGYENMFEHTPLRGTYLRRAPRPQVQPQPRPQPQVQPQVQPQPRPQPQATINFNHGQRVEVNDNGVWRPGVLDRLDNVTVTNTATGRNVNRDYTEVIAVEENRNIMPGDRVEFVDHSGWLPRSIVGIQWLPGTFVSRNYFVAIDNGMIESVPHTRIRAAQRRAPQPRAPQQAERPQGIAYEVHNAFAELDLQKFMDIVRRENNGASNFKDPNNVLEPVISYINGPDTGLSPEQKTRYINNIRGTIRENVSAYIEDHPGVKDNTLEVIQFVLSQQPNYKDLYIETFENECMGGYSSGNRQSCTKGMFERIYMANKGTIEGLCFDELQGSTRASTSAASTSTSCNPVYIKLYRTFTPGTDIDINEIFQKWYNQFSYDAIPEGENPLRNLSVEERKKHFRNFVRSDEAMTRRTWMNREFQRKLEESIQANNIIFETLNLDAGMGGRKRRRTVKQIFSKIGKKKQRKSLNKDKRKSLRKSKGKTKKRY